MRRGKIPIVLVVVCVALFAAFGTARARQAWTVDQSHSEYLHAKAAAIDAIQRAQRDGLTLADLAQVVERVKSIDLRPQPNEALLWQPTLAVFYASQTAAYRAIPAKVHARVRAVSTALRADVSARLNELQRLSRQATRLGMSVTTELRLETVQIKLMARADSPRRIQSVLASLGSLSHAYDSAVKQRQQSISGIVAKGGGTQTGVVNNALTDFQQAQSQIDLLTVIHPSDSALGTETQRGLARVRAAANVQDAAVQSASLRLQVQKVASRFKRIIPDKMIVISTEDQTGSMYEKGKLLYSSPVTTGGPELPTDHGVFHIYLKLSPFTFHSPWPPESAFYYPPTDVQYWMPFFGGEGLHDASWRSNFGAGSQFQPTDLGGGRTILGTHGCVNLPFSTAQFIWDWAPVGTTVAVI